MKPIFTMPSDQPPTIEVAPPSQAAEWDRFVRAEAGAAVYHLAGWRNLIESVFGRETYYLAARREGRLCGVLPLVRLKSLMFGDFLVSLPYVTYGGVLAESPRVGQALIQHASELAEDLGAAHVEFRHSENSFQLPARTDKVAMHLPLTGDSEILWKSLGAKLRAQIKRPLREGAHCLVGGEELVDEFYAVFAVKYRDLGVPVYPIRWFRSVLQAYPDLTRVFVVRVGAQPVAASIVIGFKDKLEVPWASSLRAADRYGVNMHLYWNMLKYAEEAGYASFDFGRSSRDSGTYRFKKQWGAEPLQLYWHYWLRGQMELPQLNPNNPKYQAAVAVWRRLPLWVTNRVGPQIVKNLP